MRWPEDQDLHDQVERLSWQCFGGEQYPANQTAGMHFDGRCQQKDWFDFSL